MKSNTFVNDALKLEFNATPVANFADNAATAPLTNLFVRLHSAFPGRGGTQATNEIAYTGYGAVAVPRTTGGFTVTGNTVAFVAAAVFGQCTAGSATANWGTVGAAATGASKIHRLFPLGVRLGPFTAKSVGDLVTFPGLTGVAVNDPVIFSAIDGSPLPGGIVEGTSYFVLTVSTNDITVSATLGGAVLDITSDGDGLGYKSTPLAIVSSTPTTPSIPASTFVFES